MYEPVERVVKNYVIEIFVTLIVKAREEIFDHKVIIYIADNVKEIESHTYDVFWKISEKGRSLLAFIFSHAYL